MVLPVWSKAVPRFAVQDLSSRGHFVLAKHISLQQCLGCLAIFLLHLVPKFRQEYPAAGLHMEFDPSKEPGNRLRSLEILCTHCRVPVYEPVQDSMDYKVVMPSYLVTGGDGFSMIPEEMKKHDSGDLDLSVVSNYISQRQRVYPLVEGRIKVWSSAPGLQGPIVPQILLALLWSFYGIL